MTWIVKINSVTKDRYMIRVSFTLTDEETGESISDATHADDLSMDRLAAIVQARVMSLEARDLAASQLTKEIGRTVTLPRDKVLTHEEQSAADAAAAADAFFEQLAAYDAAQVAFEKGLIDQAALDTSAAAAKAAWRPEYAADPRFR